MSVFAAYARYYDLLYREKDYAAEAQYVAGVLRTHAPAARSLLELGCGTGEHATRLAASGYDVIALDRSEEMLEQALRRCDSLPPEVRDRVRFRRDDARTFRASRQFDAVISLFHVVSYQTAQEDVKAFFANARRHLLHGGIFLFDFWYGPAVLTERPSRRVRRLEDEHIEVVRTAEPALHPNENIVDVHYDVQVRDKESEAEETITETHRMRYFFLPELRELLSGFEIVACEEWMTGREPGCDTWGVCVVARATPSPNSSL